MKCSYRMNEVHDCRDGMTLVNMEFGECYGKQCPYYGFDKNGTFCRKVGHEIGVYEYFKE